MKFDSSIGIVVEDDFVLDADGADIILKDGGTEFGRFKSDNSDFVIKSATQDKDILFKGDDGGSAITALTLDMSEAGAAIFNSTINSYGFKESTVLTTDDPAANATMDSINHNFSLPAKSVIVEVIIILTSSWSLSSSGYINIQIRKDAAELDNIFNSDQYLNSMAGTSFNEGTTSVFFI